MCTRAVGGLAHYIEEEGVATTQISLIRPHTEAIKPPRALWVPFDLGRPLGVPNDAELQTRVLLSVLRLLEEPSGPVLRDFPEDPPDTAGGDVIWACPVNLARKKIDLKKYPKLPRNCTGKRFDSLQSHLDKAHTTPPEKWPKPRKSTRCPSYVNENKDLLSKLRKATAAVALQLKLPPQLIASKATLASIAYKKPKTLEEIKKAGPLMTWQAELLEKPILEVFEQQT